MPQDHPDYTSAFKESQSLQNTARWWIPVLDFKTVPLEIIKVILTITPTLAEGLLHARHWHHAKSYCIHFIYSLFQLHMR